MYQLDGFLQLIRQPQNADPSWPTVEQSRHLMNMLGTTWLRIPRDFRPHSTFYFAHQLGGPDPNGHGQPQAQGQAHAQVQVQAQVGPDELLLAQAQALV
jgi:hypothetical protein